MSRKGRRAAFVLWGLICSLSIASSVSAVGYEISKVALEGDPAPQGGYTYGVIISSGLSLNNSGSIGFASALTGGAPYFSGAWILHADGSSEVVLESDTPPTVPGETYSYVDWPHMNDAGEFVFIAGINPPLSPAGWFVRRASGLELVIREGDPAPGMPDVQIGTNDSDIRILPAGDVLLGTRLVRETGAGYAIFLFGQLTTEVVVADGDTIPVPGSPVFSYIQAEADGNSLGDVAFYGEATSPFLRGLFARSDESLIAVAVAVEDDPAPVSPTSKFVFASRPRPSINEEGAIAFRSDYKPGRSSSIESGIFVAEIGAATVAISLEGNPVPGSPGRTFFDYGGAVINTAGDVAFSALSDDGADDFVAGVYVWRDGLIDVIVESDNSLPGSGGGVLNSVRHRSLALNDAGEVAFSLSLDDGRSGVYRATKATAVPGLSPLLRLALAIGLASLAGLGLRHARTAGGST